MLTRPLDGLVDQGGMAYSPLATPGGGEPIYLGLHFTYAAGRVLDGTLTARDARTLSITVADTGARYPLTLDPTIGL